MRVLATVFLLVVIAITVSLARPRHDSAPAKAQDTAPAQAPRRPRIVVELSDVMPHSPLQSCDEADASAARTPSHLRIATWNIRAAQSAPVDMIADEIRAMQADLIALQEVDIRTRRGNFVDEPGELATALGFQYVFAASIKWDEGDYGLAVLSRFPLVKVARHRLDSTPEAEPRIVLDVTVCVAGRPLHVLDHHADRRPASRALGFANLREIVKDHVGHGILVMGDLNEYPDAPGVRSLIDAGFADMSEAHPEDTVETGRVDYILADPMLAPLISNARVRHTDRSDHHAVVADLTW
jgi:endonuclease/exonuclease/phosphatase family metal-dependent hydrolase